MPQPLTQAYFRQATSTVGWTTNFLHLQPVPRYWTLRQSRMDPKHTAVKPKDRIKWWNIVPGDQVKLLGDKEGTIHEVAKVNKFNNRVHLKREQNREKEASALKPISTSKSVAYSKCQLYVGEFEFPPKDGSAQPVVLPVFATRLGTSPPVWSREHRRWHWERFAVNTVPRLPHLLDNVTERTQIPWPTEPKPVFPPPTAYDTTADAVTEVTYVPPSLPTFESIKTFIPSTPSEHVYIRSLLRPDRHPYNPSLPVEMHLVKELSNPHSRAKKQARWKEQQEHKRDLLRVLIKEEYKQLKGRSRREARAEATFKWKVRLEEEQKAELFRRWKNRGAEARMIRKRARKARKATKQEERLRHLVLQDAPHQVIPQPTVSA